MDDPSFSIAGPSRYGASYISAAELSGTVSPASLTNHTPQPGSAPGQHGFSQAQYSNYNGLGSSSHAGPSRNMGTGTPSLNVDIDIDPTGLLQGNGFQPGSGLSEAPGSNGQGQTFSTSNGDGSARGGLKRNTSDGNLHGQGQGQGQGKNKRKAESGALVQPHQDLNEFLEEFWTKQVDIVEAEDVSAGYALPLARIKKVMKSDEDVRMISAEVPIMFSKACEIFISELTCRAWLVAESQKRRTLQKSDVATAIAHSDMFDFLIDIVPRDDDEDPLAGATGAGEGEDGGVAGGSGEAGEEDGDEGEEGDDDVEG